MDEVEASHEGHRSERLICLVRYEIDPQKTADFQRYAVHWIRLVRRYGGDHYGYFITREPPAETPLSFPGLGRQAPANIAVSLFGFPDVEAYRNYRRAAREDPDCLEAEDLLQRTQCVRWYERSFMRSVQDC